MTYQLKTLHTKLVIRITSLFIFARSRSTMFSTTSLRSPSPGRSEPLLSADSLDMRGSSDAPDSSSALAWSARRGR